MTNETTYRKKGRAVILAALMVLSVVSMAGAAAAYPNDADGNGTGANVASSVTDLSGNVYQGQIAVYDLGGNGNSEVDLYKNVSDASDDWQRGLTVYDDPSVAADDFGVDETEISSQVTTGPNFVVVDSTNLESGAHYLEVGNSEEGDFSVRVQNIDASFDDASVTNINGATSANTTLAIDSGRPTFQANVSADGLDHDDLVQIFATDGQNVVGSDAEEDVIGLQARGDFVANFSGIDAGEYNFTVESVDTTAEDTATVEVRDDSVETAFTEGSYVGERGDVVNVTVDLEETDRGAVKIGDREEVNYESVVQFEDESDDGYDQITLQFNTVIAGSNGETGDEDAWSVHEDDVSIENTYINYTPNTDPITTPLGAGDYELLVGQSWDTTDREIVNEGDSAFLTLSEKSQSGAPTLNTAPGADDVVGIEDYEEATVTETDLIAEEDHAIVTIEDFGSEGWFDNLNSNGVSDGDNMSSILNASGINIEIEQADPGANAEAHTWNTSTASGEDNLTVNILNINEYDGDLRLEISTVEDHYGQNLTADDYDMTFTVDDRNAFVEDEDDEVEVESSFTVEERDLEWDDNVESVPATNATLTGDTNLAPGTEISTRARSSGNFVLNDGVDTESDRSFSTTFDFSDYEAGTEFTLRASASGVDNAEVDSVLTEGDEPQDFSYDVSTDPAEPVVGDDVTGTISAENVNDFSASEDVEFVFDGETLYNDTLELEGGASDTIVDGATLLEGAEKGDYEWELIVDGETEKSGTLTVSTEDTSDDGTSDDGSSDDGSSDDGSSDDGSSDDGSSDDGSSDGTPGFGVGVALVALLGAAMLALRRQN
ncbi:BGTF surface domain-containing protein [Natrinema salinisoli]|uniref:BGTF surface domain-containing protein n=1 Tax=Natrinema salinisoli TaxID=2878535 RepID=UPI001CF04E85|nr:BGTF surface domain-containing protein [Natrinema salinisoli]